MVDGTLFLHETEEKLTRLYQTAYSILRTRQDAEDAVQQALLKAWASRAGARPETFGPWLMRIVVNECRNIQRHRMWVMPCEAVAAEAETFTPQDPDLWSAVQALPESLRLPFSLKYVAQFTEREVAQAMHLPVSTIKNRLAKARKLLRAALADWEVSFE
jgi:RNA polymerase sigma-70 factor (ECF subfamily)